MSFKKIVLAGGGVLGSQIAYQSAYCGFDVTIWLRSEESVERCKPKVERLHGIYLKTLEEFKSQLGNAMAVRMFPKGLYPNPEELTVEKLDELKADADRAFSSIKYVTDMEEAFADADFVIEAMAENPQAKIEFYQAIAKHLPEKTVLATNSSSMLPSTFAQYTGRPEKYLALHFANNIWKGNTAEVMGHPGTEQKYYDEVVEFSSAIRMVPLCLKKEQPGYIINSMLIPFLNSAQQLLAKEVADFETIDKTWKICTGAPLGPFQILDVVGLTTAYNVVMNSPDAADPTSVNGKIAAILKEKIDAGKTGINAGEGFYKYN